MPVLLQVRQATPDLAVLWVGATHLLPGSSDDNTIVILQLYCRAPSYRLLGGKLVDSMFPRDTSWKDDPGSAASDQAASLNILREPYLITTKDGRRQTLAEYEKSLVQDYKKRSQANLAI